MDLLGFVLGVPGLIAQELLGVVTCENRPSSPPCSERSVDRHQVGCRDWIQILWLWDFSSIFQVWREQLGRTERERGSTFAFAAVAAFGAISVCPAQLAFQGHEFEVFYNDG